MYVGLPPNQFVWIEGIRGKRKEKKKGVIKKSIVWIDLYRGMETK